MPLADIRSWKAWSWFGSKVTMNTLFVPMSFPSTAAARRLRSSL